MCRKGDFIRAKVVKFGANDLHSGKVVVIWQKWLYLGNSGFIRESGCIRAQVVVFWQICCIRAKVVVIGRKGCVWAKWMCSVKSSCFRAK